MLQVTPQMRVLVAIAPVDFRKGIDGLGALCKQSLGEDPLRGTAERGPLPLVAKRSRAVRPVAGCSSAAGAAVGR